MATATASATLTVNDSFVIGNNGTGTLNVNAAGTLTSTSGADIASSVNSNGAATVAGTWNHSGGSIFVGGSAAVAGGTGGLTVNTGGTLAVTGAGNGITTYQGHGTLTLNGGTVNTPNLTVPLMPVLTAGVLNITGGAYSSSNDNLYVMAGTGKTLSVNLLNGSTFVTGSSRTRTKLLSAAAAATRSPSRVGPRQPALPWSGSTAPRTPH